MTLLRPAEAVEPLEAEVDDEAVDLEGDATTSKRSGDWRRAIAWILAIALGVAVTVALFQGPVQELWYRNRQHQLAADMNQARPHTSPGQAIAVLQVPRLGINAVVIEGDNPERLRNGPGHRVGTPAPGERGNSIVAGHRSAWGGPFAELHRVRRGDLIAVRTRASASHREPQTVVYKVTATASVGGGDTHLLRQTKDHRLTLVTGRGGTFSTDRLIVTAISGTRAPGSTRVASFGAVSSSGSVIFNFTLLVALAALGLAWFAFTYLRRRESRPVTAAIVIGPLVGLGVLCLLLNFDLLLPALS